MFAFLFAVSYLVFGKIDDAAFFRYFIFEYFYQRQAEFFSLNAPARKTGAIWFSGLVQVIKFFTLLQN